MVFAIIKPQFILSIPFFKVAIPNKEASRCIQLNKDISPNTPAISPSARSFRWKERSKLVVTYTVDPVADYQYDALGRPTTVTYANGVTETNQYDPDRHWVTRRDYKDGTTNVFYFDNTSYDAAGNFLHQDCKHTTYALDSMDYSYDNLYQITQFKENGSVVRSYDYDSNGNLTQLRHLNL